ncbi:hypothetical protein [Xylella fastidiosa]|uniref:hypothetical protein n=1 Tax=Xylella fastidiosa TaxID=2371 RepID=UPI00200CB5F6|nr:hypothetical protein [Xylella fastidiosa]
MTTIMLKNTRSCDVTLDGDPGWRDDPGRTHAGPGGRTRGAAAAAPWHWPVV